MLSPTPTCEGFSNMSEGFTNYMGELMELMEWISGRPDINNGSKNSLLPGYFR